MFQRSHALLAAALIATTPSSTMAQSRGKVEVWQTTADHQSLVTAQPERLPWQAQAPALPTIVLHTDQPRQTVEGFGFALTGGSAQLLLGMSAGARAALLRELFSPTAADSIHVSELRVSIGSSDMNDHAFTYDDMPLGQTDPDLAHFDLGPDKTTVVPVLREILALNPRIHILGSPWSAPAWMKTNNALKDGSLLPEYRTVYAQYFVKYLQAMRAQGIHIDAITVQNEPRNPHNTPSMVMSAPEQANFIADALAPALKAANLHPDIIVYDHNLDRPEYPLAILADAKARPFVTGSGFHLYEGKVEAMSQVHDAFPDKGIFFTEQMVIQKPDQRPFRISETVSRIVIGATRNWSRSVLLWNLAADPHNGPHTSDGGCPICQGAVTVDGDNVTRNLAFYTIAQIAPFVPPGSVNITSEGPADADLSEVAFLTPEHATVLIVANRAQTALTFAVHAGNRWFTATLSPLAVGTYRWR